MIISGDYLAMKCCQIAAVMPYRIIGAYSIDSRRPLSNDSDNHCGHKMGHYFGLHFSADEFSRDESFCLMRAAVVRKNQLVCTVPVRRIFCIMYAATSLFVSAGCKYFMRTAAAATVTDEGKSLAA
jgi:hypothetical protein